LCAGITTSIIDACIPQRRRGREYPGTAAEDPGPAIAARRGVRDGPAEGRGHELGGHHAAGGADAVAHFPRRAPVARPRPQHERLGTAPRAWIPGEEPDPFGLDRRLLAHGIAFEPLDPHAWPLNPFAGRSPMLEGLDPLRALRVLLRERRVDMLSCACEGPAFLPLLLRRPLRYRVPIVLSDPILSEGWKLRNRVLDAVVPRADLVTVISGFQRDYIARRWGRQDGVEVLGHTIDEAFWHAAPPAPDGPVLSVGNDHSRDYDLLLDAWRDLAPRRDLLIRTTRIAADRALPPGVEVLRQRLPDKGLRTSMAAAASSSCRCAPR
jgi:hypothetical protein